MMARPIGIGAMRGPGWPSQRCGDRTRAALVVLSALALAGCAGGPKAPATGAGAGAERDGVGSRVPSELARIPDAQPRVEPIRSGGANKPYTVLGRSYTPFTADRAFSERGLASWYGAKFHGQPTASGEPYDMYAMTAAHPTMPLPSYARIRNPANGREVVVRINDRGPFHDGRVIDLSYGAAGKLGLLRGVAPVEVERITAEDIRAGTWRRGDDATPVVTLAGGTAPSPPLPLSPPVPTTPITPMPSRASTQSTPAAPPARPTVTVIEAIALDGTGLQISDPVPQATPRAHAWPPGNNAGATFWVQLGAFGQAEGAERFRQQLERRIEALAMAAAPSLDVMSERATHRVQAGPFATREQAREAADSLRRRLDVEPLVVQRR